MLPAPDALDTGSTFPHSPSRTRSKIISRHQQPLPLAGLTAAEHALLGSTEWTPPGSPRQGIMPTALTTILGIGRQLNLPPFGWILTQRDYQRAPLGIAMMPDQLAQAASGGEWRSQTRQQQGLHHVTGNERNATLLLRETGRIGAKLGVSGALVAMGYLLAGKFEGNAEKATETQWESLQIEREGIGKTQSRASTNMASVETAYSGTIAPEGLKLEQNLTIPTAGDVATPSRAESSVSTKQFLVDIPAAPPQELDPLSVIVVNGLPNGTTLSAGVQSSLTRWAVALGDTSNLTVTLPQGTTGRVRAGVEIVNRNGTPLGTFNVELDVPPPPPQPVVSPHVEGNAVPPERPAERLTPPTPKPAVKKMAQRISEERQLAPQGKSTEAKKAMPSKVVLVSKTKLAPAAPAMEVKSAPNVTSSPSFAAGLGGPLFSLFSKTTVAGPPADAQPVVPADARSVTMRGFAPPTQEP